MRRRRQEEEEGPAAAALIQTAGTADQHDLSNTSKRPAVMDEGGYRAPGGPGSLVPASPKPSTPTSPSDRRAPFPSGGSGRYLDPKILINTPADELPEGVNPMQREDYLSDEDFENLLGVTRAEFLGMPQWRQIDLKKKAGIF